VLSVIPQANHSRGATARAGADPGPLFVATLFVVGREHAPVRLGVRGLPGEVVPRMPGLAVPFEAFAARVLPFGGGRRAGCGAWGGGA
jgi:hypothetical protein